MFTSAQTELDKFVRTFWLYMSLNYYGTESNGCQSKFSNSKITLHIAVASIQFYTEGQQLATNPRYFSIDMNYCVVIL